MSDSNNKKSTTAKDLLSRLGKKKPDAAESNTVTNNDNKAVVQEAPSQVEKTENENIISENFVADEENDFQDIPDYANLEYDMADFEDAFSDDQTDEEDFQQSGDDVLDLPDLSAFSFADEENYEEEPAFDGDDSSDTYLSDNPDSDEAYGEYQENSSDEYSDMDFDEYTEDLTEEMIMDDIESDGEKALEDELSALTEEAEKIAEENSFDDVLGEENAEDFSDDFSEEELADEYAEYADFTEEDAYSGELSEEEFNEFMYGDENSGEADGTVQPEIYEDIIPEDDFFDEDPIEEEIEDSDEEYYGEDDGGDTVEVDREKEFEELVSEVTGVPDGETDEEALTENDISLMVALGMEGELAKSVGAETATQITEDYMADQEEWVDKNERFGAGEYTNPSDSGDIADSYRKKNKITLIKMIVSFILTVILLVFENLPVIGYQPSGFVDPAVYPVVYVMVDLQIMLIGAALVMGSLGKGFKSLFTFKPTIEALPALATLVATVMSALTAYYAVPGKEPVLFNFAVALTLAFTALYEYLTVRREIFSFSIVSSKQPKFVMRNLSQRDATMENEAVSDMDTEGTVADEGDIIKIQRTDFVEGYFWRTNRHGASNDGYIGLAILFSILFTAVFALYSVFSKNGSPIAIAYATFAAATPASMMIFGAYPFYRANSQAYDNDATIIGEGSVEEYSGVGVLSFDDVNVFPSTSVKVRNVRLYNNSRIDKVLYYAASVFAATGGPLSDVFEVATMETGHSENVKILETGSGYIEASVNGKSIIFGKAESLVHLGIIIPEDVVNESLELPADCSVMYMVYQHKLVSKMIVNYVIDPDFEYILKQLTGSGMCVCVKTFDPNIDDEMIFRQLNAQGRYSLRVIKYKNTEEISKYSKNAEGGIVSRGTTKALLHTVSVCDRILSAQKTGYLIGVLSAIFGAAIVGVMLFAKSFQNLHSLYLVLCQLVWLVPALISTKSIIK